METNTETVTDPNEKGLTPGITVDDTSGDERGAGAPKAPVIENAPPPKKEEEKKEETPKTEEKKIDPEAEEIKKDEEKKEDDKSKDEDAPTEYMDYQDEGANAVVELLKEANVPVAEAHELFKEAVETGDFSKVNMATLTEKVGKAKADLIMLGVKSYYDKVTATTTATVNAVHTEVGGKANYEKVQKWAREKAGKDEAFAHKMRDFNAMFDLNQTTAIMAAKELVKMYESDSGNSSLTKKQVTGDTAATTSSSDNGYISRADYLTQVKAAYAKNDLHEVNRLRSQRKTSMS